jgi:hypothetical protein
MVAAGGELYEKTAAGVILAVIPAGPAGGG